MVCDVNVEKVKMNCVVIIYFILISFAIAKDLTNILNLFDHKKCIEGQLQILSTGYEIVSPVETALDDRKEEFNNNEVLQLITKETTVDENPISQVERIAFHNKIKYHFELTKDEGFPHKKFFEVTLHLGDERYTGQGQNLKQAKQLACLQATINTQFDKPVKKEKNADKITPTVALNNIAFKLGIKVTYSIDGDEEIFTDYSYYDAYGKENRKDYLNILNKSLNYNYDPVSVDEDNTQGPFKVVVQFGNQKFVGYGHTKQAAKHDTDLVALKHFKSSIKADDNFCLNEGINCNRNDLKSPVSSIYHVGQQHNLDVSFEVVEENGPDHKKEFKMSCILGTFITEGVDKSKKKAKAVAAQNMLNHLKTNKLLNTPVSTNLVRKSKKKKTKVVKENKFIKNSKETLNGLWNSVLNVVESSFHVGKSQHKDDVGSKKNYKDQMLGLTSTLGIETKFTDVSKSDSLHYSLLSLETYPPHLCLGKGDTIETAQNKASLYGLSFLKKLGVDFMIPKNIVSSNTEYHINIKDSIVDIEEET